MRSPKKLNNSFKVEFALLCDFAYTTEGGKLSFVGMFETIYTDILPTSHPEMFLVAHFKGVSNTVHKIRIKAVDSSGSNIFSEKERFVDVRLSNSGSGNLLFRMLNFSLTSAGNYYIEIYDGERKVHSINLNVIKVEKLENGLPN